MFDFGVGYSELFVLGLIAVVVIGPKDLPKVLRMFGQFTRKMRGMARDFQGHVDAAMKDAGIDDIKKSVQDAKSSFPTGNAMMGLDPAKLAQSNDFDKIFDAKGKPGETKIAGVGAESPAS
jgi:sec-independent protein translocase protein TatB